MIKLLYSVTVAYNGVVVRDGDTVRSGRQLEEGSNRVQDQDQAVAGMQLADLIRGHHERTGERYKQMAARGGLPATTLSNLATNPLRQMPARETLEGVAKALSVDVTVVTRAAGAACGYTFYEDESLPDDPDTQAIIANLGDLTPDQRRLMLLQAQAWVRDNLA